SPSRMTPGPSSATAPRVRVMEPLTLTSAAARWPGSSSRPTTLVLEERFLRSTEVGSAAQARGLSVKRAKRARRPASRRVVLGGSDYHLPLVGQPPVSGFEQVRVTTPPALLMVNVPASELFDVTVSVYA